jgi:hypothetical protein
LGALRRDRAHDAVLRRRGGCAVPASDVVSRRHHRGANEVRGVPSLHLVALDELLNRDHRDGHLESVGPNVWDEDCRYVLCAMSAMSVHHHCDLNVASAMSVHQCHDQIALCHECPRHGHRDELVGHWMHHVNRKRPDPLAFLHVVRALVHRRYDASAASATRARSRRDQSGERVAYGNGNRCWWPRVHVLCDRTLCGVGDRS